MLKRFTKVLFFLALIGVTSAAAHATISAYAFGDYYFIKHHDEKADGQHGFWLRRIYFTYDRDISDKFKARVRLEMANEGKFSESITMVPFVKDAYIQYSFHSLHALVLGIQESLAFANTEKFWGFRHVEKTPYDLYKVRSSREFGLTLKGSFDKGKNYGYALSYGNNSGNKEEINKHKGVYARLTAAPVKGLMLELYYDSLSSSSTKSTTLFSGFAGFQQDWGRFGVSYGAETIKEDGKSDVKTDLLSFLAAFSLAKNLEVFGRYDTILDPAPWAQGNYILMTKGYKTNLLIAGLAWNIHPKVQIAPNIKIMSYGENADGVAGPKSDTYYSLTFYYQF